MKKWFKNIIVKCLFIMLMASTGSASGQTTKVVQAVTASATVAATTDVLLFTGGTGGTATLPSSPAAGRVVTVVNQSTGDVTLSPAVRVMNGVNTSLLSPSSGEILPGTISNQITVIYHSGVWYKLN